ncbi:MAG: hypothetical protein ACK56F_07315, partial [bacterium]
LLNRTGGWRKKFPGFVIKQSRILRVKVGIRIQSSSKIEKNIETFIHYLMVYSYKFFIPPPHTIINYDSLKSLV